MRIGYCRVSTSGQTLEAQLEELSLFAVALALGLVVWSSPMTLILEEDEVLSAAIAGVPRVAELIATVPAEGRSRALEAAEKSYLKTAQTLGYQDADAQQWASAVMSRLTQQACTDETIELHMLGGTLRFGSAAALNIYIEDNLANTPFRKGDLVSLVGKNGEKFVGTLTSESKEVFRPENGSPQSEEVKYQMEFVGN
jgi:hypothetical protein